MTTLVKILRISETHAYLHLTQSATNASKTFRTYLHLGSFNRIVSVFPVVPRHSSIIDLTMKIQTIQIGPVAIVVPPGAFFMGGTVAAVLVIITIFGGKCHTTMITKGITSGSYKMTIKRKKETDLKYVDPIFRFFFSFLS